MPAYTAIDHVKAAFKRIYTDRVPVFNVARQHGRYENLGIDTN